MDPELERWIERRFAVPAPRSEKVVPLAVAIDRWVRPGDAVHLGLTHARGSAAFWELIRRFAGTDPRFTFLAVQMTTPQAPLVHAGLAARIVTSWAGDSYRTPGPNPVYQRAWSAGLPFEQWSILTYAQRLAAGARGASHATTTSLVGSAMERNEGVRVLDDGRTALVPALVPDVSIFHAPAADAAGNVVFSPPLFENVHGALAARRGVIVTVDRIVPSDVVRAHAHLTRIPASSVLAVVEAPLGAHPGGLLPTGIDGVDGYGEDYDFWVALRRAGADPAAMDAWIREWVLETGTHDGYLARLGAPRIAELRRRSEPSSWRVDLRAPADAAAPPNAIEWAIVAAARVLRGRVREHGYTAMLAGAGMANLAAWIAAYELADEGVAVDLVAEMGLVGYWPRPGEPILFNQRNFPTCTMLTDIEHTLGVLIGGGRARSIGALGAAQVDRHGAINSTEIPGARLLMGSGGANDVVTNATESVVLCAHAPDRLVERVSYVTGPGTRVRTVVSTLGVLEKDERGELVLTAVFGDDPEAAAKECVARCGWSLHVAPRVTTVAPPTHEEIRTLRLLDPEGWFRS